MTKTLQNTSKLLVSALVVAFIAVLTLTGVNAAPSTITVKQVDHTQNFIGNTDIAMPLLKSNDGVSVYCMDIDKKFASNGQSLSYVGDADAGVKYILQNGYPNRSYKNNKGMDAYVTQMALWWYLSEGKVSSEFKNATGEADRFNIVATTKKLVAEARSAKDTQVSPSINVAQASQTMTLSSDGKYYESALLSATTTGANTYNVELGGKTANTTVVDEQGNIGTTMNNGEKFKVRVPVAEISKKLNINVKFITSATLKKAKIYKPADKTYQRVVGLYNETVSVNKVITLTAKKRVCEYTDGKYYGNEGKEVDQNTYNKECNKSCSVDNGKYYGKDGKETTKDKYTEECKNICEVIDGKYYGKDGEETTKDKYNKECAKSCSVDNGKYYGKNGKETTKEKYTKECGKVCVFTDDKYYGKDGKEVDQNTYNKQCNSSCAIIDNKYYGKDGKEVDKNTFDKQCKNICQVNNGKYYGINGNQVDKDTFDRQCGQEVVVPNTSANIVFWSIGLGILAIASGVGIIAYRNHKKQKGNA